MADPIKQPAAGDGQPNNGDASKQNQGDPSKSNAGDGKGNPSVDLSNFISKADYEKNVSERDGTISALTKKINALETGLKSALGLEGDDGKKLSTDDLVNNLQTELNQLKTERQEAAIKEVVNEYLNDYKDSKGNPLNPEAKAYIKKRFATKETDPKVISKLINSEIEDLSTIMNTTGAVDKTKAESRPDSRGSQSGSGKKTANEILKSIRGE